MDKYWIYGLFTKDDQIIEGAVTKDGLLVKLNYEDAKPLLSKYPTNDKGMWYFNDTKDREIAETEICKLIIANPQLLWQNGWEIHT